MQATTQAPDGTPHPVFREDTSPGSRSTGLRGWAVRQFRQPYGFWGRVAGWIMATRPSNLERNRWTVDLLDVQPTDWVLEIGFGPGVALGWLSERANQGLVVGMDHSELMLSQAARRNAQALASGRIALQLGDAEHLPDLGTVFDRIMAVNVAMFWSDPVAQFRALRERLRPGGRIALTVQPRSRGATDTDAQRIGERMLAQLSEAGFREVRLELHPMQPVAAACAIGHR
ncbi:MAG TPA: class I SAM-dependent methyltransferase [bacterium]|nr:class I SAM-dependent methyltransferase [bacterium]